MKLVVKSKFDVKAENPILNVNCVASLHWLFYLRRLRATMS